MHSLIFPRSSTDVDKVCAVSCEMHTDVSSAMTKLHFYFSLLGKKNSIGCFRFIHVNDKNSSVAHYLSERLRLFFISLPCYFRGEESDSGTVMRVLLLYFSTYEIKWGKK